MDGQVRRQVRGWVNGQRAHMTVVSGSPEKSQRHFGLLSFRVLHIKKIWEN